jgi:hypothetical protein
MALFFECMLSCAHKVLDRGRHCQRCTCALFGVQQVRYLTSTEQASNSLILSHFLFTEGRISLSAAISIRCFLQQSNRIAYAN